jgi:DNA polymerase III psi subunit
MTEVRRRAYLEAMGLDIWLRKPPPAERDRLVVGPGAGSALLVCARPEASSGKLAADIARAIGSEPVWAWPEAEGDASNPTLEEAVGERLVTRLLIFGADLARALCGPKVPDVLLSAAVHVAPDLDELAARGSARRALWRAIANPAD